MGKTRNIADVTQEDIWNYLNDNKFTILLFLFGLAVGMVIGR